MRLGRFDLRGNTRRLKYKDKVNKYGVKRSKPIGTVPIEDKESENDRLQRIGKECVDVFISEVSKESKVQAEQKEQRDSTGNAGRESEIRTDRMRELHGVQKAKSERMAGKTIRRVKSQEKEGYQTSIFDIDF